MSATETKVFSILGGTKRRDRWRVAQDTSILTVFGRTYLDLRQAGASEDLLDISIFTVFGSVTIVMPEGTDVRPSDGSFLASSSCVVPASNSASHLPPIDIDATTILGRLRIRIANEKELARYAGKPVGKLDPTPAAVPADEPDLLDEDLGFLEVEELDDVPDPAAADEEPELEETAAA